MDSFFIRANCLKTNYWNTESENKSRLYFKQSGFIIIHKWCISFFIFKRRAMIISSIRIVESCCQVLFIGLLLLCMQNVNAQQDTLLLFTKPDCSNCQATKQALRQSGISFFEKSLDDSENAKKCCSDFLQWVTKIKSICR